MQDNPWALIVVPIIWLVCFLAGMAAEILVKGDDEDEEENDDLPGLREADPVQDDQSGHDGTH